MNLCSRISSNFNINRHGIVLESDFKKICTPDLFQDFPELSESHINPNSISEEVPTYRKSFESSTLKIFWNFHTWNYRIEVTTNKLKSLKVTWYRLQSWNGLNSSLRNHWDRRRSLSKSVEIVSNLPGITQNCSHTLEIPEWCAILFYTDSETAESHLEAREITFKFVQIIWNHVIISILTWKTPEFSTAILNIMFLTWK